MPPVAFNPDAEFVEEKPVFDAAKPFDEEKPSFDPSQPFEDAKGVDALEEDPAFAKRKPTTLRQKFNDAMMPLTVAGGVVNAGVQDAAATLTGNPSQGGNLYEMFTSKEMPGEQTKPLPFQRTLADISKKYPVTATAGKIAGGLVESAPMLATLPQGAIGKLIGAGFTADMIAHIPDAGKMLGEEMGKNPEDRNHDNITTALATIASSAAMAGVGVAHIGKSGIKTLADQLKNEPVQFKPGAENQQMRGEFAKVRPGAEPLPPVETTAIDPATGNPVPSSAQVTLDKAAQRMADLEAQKVNAPKVEAVAEPTKPSIAPEVDRFIKDFNDPAKRVTNASDDPNVTTTQKSGLGVKSLDDLKALAELDRSNKAELKAIRAKRESGQALTPEESKRYMELGMKVQFPREVIETATNSGSWSESNQTRVGKPLPERPLDWKKNPEVEKWLRENGEQIGIKLEEPTVEPIEQFKARIDAEKAAKASAAQGAGTPPVDANIPPVVGGSPAAPVKPVKVPKPKPVNAYEGRREFVNLIQEWGERMGFVRDLNRYAQGVSDRMRRGHDNASLKGTIENNKVVKAVHESVLRALGLDPGMKNVRTLADAVPKLKELIGKFKKFEDSFLTRDDFTKTRHNTEDLTTGDKLTSDGETIEVTYKSADGAVLVEGPNIGRQRFNPGQEFWVDDATLKKAAEFTPEVEAEPAKPVEQPKPDMTGKDLVDATGKDTLSLVGEKAVDQERVKAEAEQAAKDKAEADAQQGKFTGMGGAVPSEFEQHAGTPTSIKNATVDGERAKRGLPPAMAPAKRTFGEVWDKAMAKIDQDPGYPDALIAELRKNPRALTDLEDAVLLHRQIDLQNEYGKATRDLAQAFDDGRHEAVIEEKARVARISDQLFDLYEINKKVGTETGRGLNARKMMAYEDFSLAKMELEKRAGANDGAPLTDTQRAEIVALHKKITETQKAYDEYVAKAEAEKAAAAVKEAFDRLEREAQSSKAPKASSYVIQLAEKWVAKQDLRADAARKRLRERLGRTSAGVDPTILSDLAEIGASHIGHIGLDLAKFTERLVGDVGDFVKPHIEEVFAASKAIWEKSSAPAEVKKRVLKVKDMTGEQRKADLSKKIADKFETGKKDEISTLVRKLARQFVEDGITDRDALIDAVHGVLKEIQPEMTRREAMDAISGYGEFRQLSKDEVSLKLRDLKGQMQQVAKLEDMQSGKPPLKTGLERRTPSAEESRLIRAVNEAKNQFQIPISDPNTQLKSSLDTLKARLRSDIEKYQGMLARGEFEQKPKRILKRDAEADRLSYDAQKAKAEWHEDMMKDRLAKQTAFQKTIRYGGEVLNTSRAILTSMDLSAVLRQGGFIALGHPIRAAKAFPAMFKAFRSERGQHAVNEEILARKNYPLYQQSKLYLSSHGHKLSQMEEAYMSRWAEKIPLVAGSERAYVTFLNKLRADSFDAMAATLKKSGELTPEEGRAIANFVNVATGRGNLGMKENALVGLNTVFFAPRLVASRFQLLAGQPLYRGTARTRKLVAAEYGRYLVALGLIYALAKQDGAQVEDDPRSSDFGKLRYGNTRVDMLSGLTQPTILMSRLASGETKTAGGKIVPIRGDKVPFGSSDSAQVMGRFARSKLSPWAGTTVDILAGKNVVGEKVTPESVAKNLLVPLSMQDIYATMLEQGIPRGTALGLLSTFGAGLQNYDNKKEK